jgi:hypothetical protein
MKTAIITTGAFANKAGQKGNFFGRTATGNVGGIFIKKEKMESIGITTDAQFKKPIYAIIAEELITPNDENGNPLAPVLRVSAMSVYKTEAELIEATVADNVLDTKIAIAQRKALEDALESAELTEQSVNAILSASSLF